MMYLSCYDIENDRVRTRVADRLLGVGLERIQFSVFIGPLSDSQRVKLLTNVEKLLENTKESNFLLIPLTPTNVDAAYHCGDKPPDWEYLSGTKLTLII